MDSLLKVENLSALYQTKLGEKVYAVDQVSFALKRGQILGVAGESGCGKSTLALSLTGQYLPPLDYVGGEVFLEEYCLTPHGTSRLEDSPLGKRVSYVPQAAMNTLNPTLKIKHLVYDIVHRHEPTLKKNQILQMATTHFKQLGLDARVLDVYPHQLSGGMKQRTVIALATILSPTLLIADEPTSALDVTSQKKVIALLKKLLDEKRVEGIVFITHELPLLYHIADDILIMYAGQVVEHGTKASLMNAPQHPYTKALMGSVVTASPGIKNQKLTVLEGAPPNLKKIPKGCRFYDRCPKRRPECMNGVIPMKENLRSHYRCLLEEDDHAAT